MLNYTLTIKDLTKEDEWWPDYQLAERYVRPEPTGPLADIVKATLRSRANSLGRLILKNNAFYDHITAMERARSQPFAGGQTIVTDNA